MFYILLRKFKLFSMGGWYIRYLFRIISFCKCHCCFKLHTIPSHLHMMIRIKQKLNSFYIQCFQWTTAFKKKFLCKIIFSKQSSKMCRNKIFIFHMLQNQNQYTFPFLKRHNFTLISSRVITIPGWPISRKTLIAKK